MIGLLAPAGNLEKLKTALHFGADAVYLAYKQYGLRAYADNFDKDELLEAVRICHNAGKKVYVTLNIFAHNDDFENIEAILDYCVEVDVKGIFCFRMGLTLRDGNRQYFYKKLDEHFPGLKERYIKEFGDSYGVGSPNNDELMKYFKRLTNQVRSQFY